MPSLAELGFKERVINHDDEYRASLYTEAGFFVAWYRRSVRTSNGAEIKDTSTQIIVVPQLSQEQILGAQAWLEQHQA